MVSDGRRESRIDIGSFTRGLVVTDDLDLVGSSIARRRSRSTGVENQLPASLGWAGVAVVDRHRHRILDKWGLGLLGEEIFDTSFLPDFSDPPETPNRASDLVGRVEDTR